MNDETKVGMGIGAIVLFIIALNVTVGGLATEYVVEYWAGIIRHHAVDVPFLLAALAGLFVGQFMVPAAILTWLFHFFI